LSRVILVLRTANNAVTIYAQCI